MERLPTSLISRGLPGCEALDRDFDSLVKEYIIDLWEVRKVNYMEIYVLLSYQSLAGDPRDGTMVGGTEKR